MFFAPFSTTKITFNQLDDNFTLHDFSKIFNYLVEVDRIHYGFYRQIDMEYRPLPDLHRSKVTRLSKESPFYIEIFSNIEWGALLILLISLNREDAKRNLKKNILDFKQLLENPGDFFRSFNLDLSEENKKHESSNKEYPFNEHDVFLKKFILYFNSLNEKQQKSLINKIYGMKSVLRLIKNINGRDLEEF